jgi:2-keto-4-pentenoate hydratase/2-oxohepta-3-ene-1,7-dioic acid hydratase in catechol pathway
MKIVSFGPPHGEQPGIYVDGGQIAPLAPILVGLGFPALDTNALLSLLPYLQPLIEEAIAKGAQRFPADQVRLGSPVPKPEKVIVAGGNYQSHVDEAMGRKDAPSPSEPLIIFKPSNIVIGPNDALICPAISEQLDYETEIAVVIGRGGRYIPRDRAMEHVAGFMIGNDVTARDMAFKDVAVHPLYSQITRAKAIRTGAPFGPWLVTPDEIPDPSNLRLQCWVNGELRQDGMSSEMIVDIPSLIEDFSKLMDMSPGDVIFTGTTTGCGAFQKPPQYLRHGDVVRMEISGLGVMETPIVKEGHA